MKKWLRDSSRYHYHICSHCDTIWCKPDTKHTDLTAIWKTEKQSREIAEYYWW